MAPAFASTTPAARGRLFIRAAGALCAALALPWCHAAADRTNVATRFGPVETHTVPDAGADRSDVRFRGAPLGQVDGDASLFKLSVQDDSDYVLADAFLPGLHCHHRFTLLQVGPGDEATMSHPFGDCMTLFGARRAGGKLVIQLAQDGVALPQSDPVVHEFVWTQDRLKELTNVLTRCEAVQAAAASDWTPVAPAQAGRIVTGTGRAWFHTAPVDECRTASLFVIPGDVLTVLHVYRDYADVTYRNPRTGREASGWVRLDRLAAGASKP